MKENYDKIIIIGQTGSGKSYLINELIKQGLKTCLKCTTRPQRLNEIQGITYDFIDNSEFEKRINDNKFLAYDIFNIKSQIWYYGLTTEEFNNSQIIMLTPNELSYLNSDQRKNCFVIYLDIDRDIRESRLIKRNDKNDSIKRRLDSDEIDFKNYTDYDMRITNDKFTITDVYDICEIIK